VGLVVMVFLAGVFGLSFFIYGVMLVPYLIMLLVFGIALGIIACAIVLKFGPASEWFIWPIPALISPFVGVLYPLSTLPPWMRWIGRLFPPSYVFEGMRTILAGGHPSWSTLGGAAILNLVFLLAGFWIFSLTYKYAVRTGLIARYSAETVA
jgi:ABC-2 type transport system permease protein